MSKGAGKFELSAAYESSTGSTRHRDEGPLASDLAGRFTQPKVSETSTPGPLENSWLRKNFATELRDTRFALNIDCLSRFFGLPASTARKGGIKPNRRSKVSAPGSLRGKGCAWLEACLVLGSAALYLNVFF